MTRRPTPWCLPNESGPDGGMARSTVCMPTSSSSRQIPASFPPLYPTSRVMAMPGPCSGPGLPASYPLFPALSLVWTQLPISLAAARLNGTTKGERRREPGGYDSSSTLMSSELETTSFFDSDEDDSTSRWGLIFLGTGMGVRREVTNEAAGSSPLVGCGHCEGTRALLCLL